MELKSIKYAQYEGTPKEWRLEKLPLGKINLIVGSNATGKTKIFNIIHNLGRLLAGERKHVYQSGYYEIIFNDAGDKIAYSLRYENLKVVEEKLKVGKAQRLDREKGGKGKIYVAELNRKLAFHVPDTELACVSRRDSVQHPFLERLNVWGKSVRQYAFGTPLGKDMFAVIMNGKDVPTEINLKDAGMVVGIFTRGVKKYPKKFVKNIIKDMEEIGYNLEKIDTTELANTFAVGMPAPAIGICVKEVGLNSETTQHDMSQGMFRVLSLIIQLNYSQMCSEPSCILVDDIGEGLDFERASALIKLLIDKAEKSGVQLIMTTNDRFVMNNVPLEYWSVVQRVSGGTKVYNYANSKKVFDEFGFTGLSNFDFFTSRSYEKGDE